MHGGVRGRLISPYSIKIKENRTPKGSSVKQNNPVNCFVARVGTFGYRICEEKRSKLGRKYYEPEQGEIFSSPPPEKSSHIASFFQLNPSCDGINLLSQMKSLRDEIAFQADKKTDLISSKPQDFDFIQIFGFHLRSQTSDFISITAYNILQFDELMQSITSHRQNRCFTGFNNSLKSLK